MDQRGIVTVTLNPALDLSSVASDVRPGPKLRCSAPRAQPGGGGINVTRAIDILGGTSLPLVALGGPTGHTLADMLLAEGISPRKLEIPGETRQMLAVTDSKSGHQFRFVMPGPDWSDAHAEAALTACLELARPGAWVVLSGSQPPGMSEDFPADLSLRLAGVGAQLAVDTSGEPLRALCQGGTKRAALSLLRCDQAEASAVAGHRLSGPTKAAAFAADLVARNVARTVVIACGADGSVMATEQSIIHCRAPRVPVVSRLGAGDSFLAAFVLDLARGGTLPEALRHGTAAAAAAVMTSGTRLCSADNTARLLPQCDLRTL